MDFTAEEERLFKEVIRTKNWDLFTEYYFRLPYSGTWFTPEDNPVRFSSMYKFWRGFGEPDDKFIASIDGEDTELQVVWDPYYGGYPIFLLKHGFRTLDWMKEFLDPGITKAVATTGTGSGKTAGVGIFALMCCALFPGFRFLNVAPTQTQAGLILGEIEKWAGNSEFAKFIQRSRGANELWKEKDYPTITVVSPVNPNFPSTFICQTSGQDARNIIGGERDWINVDEAQLMFYISTAENILVTRMRGTRSTGIPRWTKLTWITNPGPNAELVALIESYQELVDAGDDSVLVLRDIDSSVNIYITKRQLHEQAKTMSQRERDRWMGGQMSAVYDDAMFPEEDLERCRSDALDEEMEKVGKFHDELGLMEYELPYEPGHDYVVVGDVGKSPLVTFSSMNAPALMVFDLSSFLERPVRLVAFFWLDGQNTYSTFIDKMRYLLLKYRCRAYYDAGNVQSAFEDLGGFQDIPFTQPIVFSGSASVKKHAITVASILMQNGLFEWPYIKGLWYQARVYNPSSRKIPDDIMTCLLVFARILSLEGTLWSRFTEFFQWDRETPGEGIKEAWESEEIEQRPVAFDRHARILAG